MFIARTTNASQAEGEGILNSVLSKKMSGEPVFKGTRVPVAHLFEYLEKGETLTEFLRQFPSVTHNQALAVLEH